MKKCPLCGRELFAIDGKLRCKGYPILCTFEQEIGQVDYNSTCMIFDLETTGFNRSTDRIIEIAAIKCQGKKVIDEFHQYVKPDSKNISQKISDLTGITNEQVKDEPEEDVAIPKFIDWYYDTSKAPVPEFVVGHNGVKFDCEFIKFACRRQRITYPFQIGIDTLTIAKDVLASEGLQNYKQTTIAEHYGVKYDAHAAINDAKALHEIYLLLIDDMKKKGITKDYRVYL